MDRLYYQPNHLWKGKAAVKKLAELSEEKPKVIKNNGYLGKHSGKYIYQLLRTSIDLITR